VPARLVVCLSASILSLWLGTWPPLAVLALASASAAARRVSLGLLLKAWLFLALALSASLLGSLFIPVPGGDLRASQDFSVYLLKHGLLPALRLFSSLNLALWLALSSPSASLSRLLAALPLPNCLFVPMAVMLRFVAALAGDLGQAREAMMAREGQGLMGIFLRRPGALWRGLMVPMVFSALRLSDELSESAELKGLEKKAMFWPRPALLGPKDAGPLLLGAALLALMLYLELSGGEPGLQPPGRA
jgi:energy-coupling factor transport system permease protein